MAKENFSQYGKEFQETLCQLVLLDRPFADQIFEVLNINFLELKHLQVFIKVIQKYREKHKTHPSEVAMKAVLRTQLSDEPDSVQKLVRDYFARIHKTEPLDAEYIKDTS